AMESLGPGTSKRYKLSLLDSTPLKERHMRVLLADYMRQIYEAIAEKFGATPEEARIFADSMVIADLQGKETQGIALIRLFYDLLKDGAGRFGAPIRIINEGPAFAVLDGGHGIWLIGDTRAMVIDFAQCGRADVGLD